MHFIGAFRILPLSTKERKRREAIANGFIGQWNITSTLPFAGTLFIKKAEKDFGGLIEFGQGVHSGDSRQLARVSISGDKIGFGITWKDTDAVNSMPENWFCLGRLQGNAERIDGKIHLWRGDNPKAKKAAEFDWSATKAH